MPSLSEVGASDVHVEDYKCSIESITVTNKSWKKPGAKVSTEVTATVFDNQTIKSGKTIYVISNPQGKKVIVRAKKKDGQCSRPEHKKYKIVASDYNSSLRQHPIPFTASNIPQLVRPYVLKNTPLTTQETLGYDKEFSVKCFEIGGVLEAFKYLKLPIPVDKEDKATFSFHRCKEGAVKFNIISYPDFNYSLKFKVGWKEEEKRKNNTSHFERATSSRTYTDDRQKALVKEGLDTKVKLAPPSVEASMSYNGGRDKQELKIDFDTKKEVFNLHLERDGRQLEIGSELIQDAVGGFKKVRALGRLLGKFANAEFLKDLVDFDPTQLVDNYKAYKFKLNPPSVSVFVTGQYCTSQDLARVGRYLVIGCKLDPLLSISLTIDLLFLLLTLASAGSAAGFLVMLKNLDKVVEKLLGKHYKKQYKDTKPFEADIFINLIITGSVGGNFDWVRDTTEKRSPHSLNAGISGTVKVDLECGAKLSVDLFLIQVEAEAKATGSSGIEIRLGFEDRLAQGRGIALQFETFFLGLKITYVASAKAGLMKTVKGGVGVDGVKELLKCKKLEVFSGEHVFFSEVAEEKKAENPASGGGGSGLYAGAKYGAGSVVGIG